MASPQMHVHKVEFPGSGGHTLAARLEIPVGGPRAYAVFAHCFTCSKDVVAATRISRALARRQIAVLRFDFTGLGSSEGEFENTNFSSNVADLVAACRYQEDNHGPAQLLVGHSLGGAAVLAAAGEVESVKAVATIAAPAEPSHVERLLADDKDQIHGEGEACVELAGRKFKIQRQFLEDIGAQRLRERIANLGRALLILHAPTDETVGIENATSIFVAAKHPKSFVSLDDADHLLTRREDAEYVGGVLAAWAERYLEMPAVRLPEPDHSAVTVRTLPGHKFAQEVIIGDHRFLADEPPVYGGDDLGPDPYELLSSALGACTSMTLQMYADRKEIALERVSTRVRHEKIHAKDCEDCETTKGKVDVLHREIELHGDLDDEARARLLRIADKCPVHKTLHNEVKVRTREVPS